MKRITTDTLSLLVLAFAITALEVRFPTAPARSKTGVSDSVRQPAPVGAIATFVGQPLALCILLDTSGSMASDLKLQSALHAIDRLMGLLGPDDEVALVVYSNDPWLLLPWSLAPAARQDFAHLRVRASGATNLSAAMRLGEQVLEQSSKRRHLLILSDGAPNRGLATADGLLAQTRQIASQGIRISAIGLGVLRDEGLLARIAFAGSGSYGSSSHISGFTGLLELIVSFRD